MTYLRSLARYIVSDSRYRTSERVTIAVTSFSRARARTRSSSNRPLLVFSYRDRYLHVLHDNLTGSLLGRCAIGQRTSPKRILHSARCYSDVYPFCLTAHTVDRLCMVVCDGNSGWKAAAAGFSTYLLIHSSSACALSACVSHARLAHSTFY
jgi:hypothetical protein